MTFAQFCQRVGVVLVAFAVVGLLLVLGWGLQGCVNCIKQSVTPAASTIRPTEHDRIQDAVIGQHEGDILCLAAGSHGELPGGQPMAMPTPAPCDTRDPACRQNINMARRAYRDLMAVGR